MKHISNEEKAVEFATSYDGKIISFAHLAALQMGAWKDEQHEQEKQQLIDRLEDWLANNICNAYNFRGDDISATFIDDCIKSMKGE